MRQSILISEPRDSPDLAVDSPSVIELTSGGRFPDIGVEASTAPDPVPKSVAGVFRVVELDLSNGVWPAALHGAASDGLPLDVRIVSDGDRTQASAAPTALAQLSVLRVGVFDSELHTTTLALMELFAAAMRAAGVRAPLVGGARSHFTELNREHSRIPSDLESLLITVAPLFHALDTEQLVEALAMQRIVAGQAVDLAAGRNVHIGPVSLRPRFNNVATTPSPCRHGTTCGTGTARASPGPQMPGRNHQSWRVADRERLCARCAGGELVVVVRDLGPARVRVGCWTNSRRRST